VFFWLDPSGDRNLPFDAVAKQTKEGLASQYEEYKREEERRGE